jgi:DnaJ-class molecular chaperone
LVGEEEEEETMIRNFRFKAPTNHPGSTIQTDSRRLIQFPTRCCLSPDLSHYTVLGLTPLASQTEVKRAFKRLALKYHPDVHKGQDKDFKEIKSAYECLMQKFKKEEEEMEITEMGEIDEWEEWMGFEGGIPSGISY